MGSCDTKSQLYTAVNVIREHYFCKTLDNYSVDIVQECEEAQARRRFGFQLHEFSTQSLRGMALIAGDSGGMDGILVSSTLGRVEQNFLCRS